MSKKIKRRTYYADILVGVTILILFLAAHPRVMQLFSSAYLGSASGDGGLYVWLTQSFHHNPPQALRFETNAFYPYPLTRAWSDSFLLPSAVASLLVSVGLSAAAAYNSVLIAAIVLNGIATFRLALRLGLTTPFAAASGIVLANSSYFIGNLGHPQLMFFFWIPFAWAAVVAPSASIRIASRRWLVAGLCVSGAFFCAVYYAIFAAIGLSLIWLCAIITGQMSQRRLLRTLLLAALGIVPVMVTLPPYLAVQSFFGTRGLYEAAAFAASGLSYLAFSPQNRLFGFTADLSHGEAWLCPGYALMVVAVLYGVGVLQRRSFFLAFTLSAAIILLCTASSVVDRGTAGETTICITTWIVLITALVAAVKRTTPQTIMTLIALTFFVFSFGPGGNPIKHEPTYSPFGLFYAHVPGLASIRAVGRFGSVVILGLTILAARGCQSLYMARSRSGLLASLFIFGFSLLENSISKLAIDAIPPRPEAFEALAAARQSHEAAIILPFAGALENGAVKHWSELANLSTRYAQWSEPLNIPIVNGYSGQRSKLHYDLPRAMAYFPDARAFEYLSRLCGVRWVVIVPSLDKAWSAPAFQERLATSSAQILQHTAFSDGSILIKLADIPILISGEMRPIIAPATGSTTLTITPAGEARCEVHISSLQRDDAGELTAVPVTQQLIVDKTDIALPTLLEISRAAPRLIHVSTQQCEATAMCSVP